jgi:urea transport system permease protein
MTETTPIELRLPVRVGRSRRWQVLPVTEVAVLAIAALLPLVLQDYLTIYATRVLILCLFALSFDLVWGYAGIMSFGQAVFFGSAGYGVALIARDLGVTSMLIVLPAGLLIGLTFALLLGGFLLLGRHPSSVIFVSLGTLTGSYAFDRLARGWYYLGGQNGIPSIPPMSLGSYDLSEGPVFYYFALGIAVRIGARRPARE